MSALFFKGLAFVFVLAATVGPMWVLCLRRTLAFGGRLRARLGSGLLRGINLVSGTTILGFAAWQVGQLLR